MTPHASLLPKKPSRPISFDITSLNVFDYCRCLRYVGKGLMAAVVGSLIVVASHSVLTLSLLPRARSSPSTLSMYSYFIISLLYLSVIGMICWCYWRTMIDDPGLVGEYNPFDSFPLMGAGNRNGNENGSGNGNVIYTMASRLHADASFREHVTQTYTETLRSDMYRAAKAPSVPREKRLALAYQYETRPRYCKKCNTWKPPRSHHCSMAGACVLKMDHYCVWMGNTIGLLNYRSFVLFLAWTCAGCAMSALLLLEPSVAFVRGDSAATKPTASVGSVVGGILGFVAFVFTAAFTLALIGFLVMHGGLVARNMTTIEAYEKRKVEPWPWRAGSWRENVAEVFGGDERSPMWRKVVPWMDPAERTRLVHVCGHVKHRVNVVEFLERAGVMEAV